MARKTSKSRKHPGQSKRTPAPQHSSESLSSDVQAFLRTILSNRSALVGFGLSLCQIPIHLSWILLISYLTQTGQAKTLSVDSFMSWLIVSLLGTGLIFTVVSLFVCLVYGLRQPPRVLAVVGLMISFFVGSLATALVFMSAIRNMSSP